MGLKPLSSLNLDHVATRIAAIAHRCMEIGVPCLRFEREALSHHSHTALGDSPAGADADNGAPCH
jgi:hypothetical protein